MESYYVPFSSMNEAESLAVEELIVKLADEAAHTHKLTQSIVTIGRDGSNDIVLETGAVSRHHARLEWRRGTWYLTDLDSTNGTVLKDRRLEAHTLTVLPFGQQVQIGPYEMLLRQGAPLAVGRPDMTEFLMPAEAGVELGQIRELYGRQPVKAPVSEPFTFGIWPTKAVPNGRVIVAIQNEASVPKRFIVEASGDSRLRFSQTDWQVDVAAGLEKRFAFLIQAQRRPLFGDKLSCPFQVSLGCGGKQLDSAGGVVEVDPRLSTSALWLVLFLLFLTVLSYLVAVLIPIFRNFG